MLLPETAVSEKLTSSMDPVGKKVSAAFRSNFRTLFHLSSSVPVSQTLCQNLMLSCTQIVAAMFSRIASTPLTCA
jgi:hypothetical protein